MLSLPNKADGELVTNGNNDCSVNNELLPMATDFCFCCFINWLESEPLLELGANNVKNNTVIMYIRYIKTHDSESRQAIVMVCYRP